MVGGSISLAEADTIADATLARGRETECWPLTVAVLDPGGHLVVLKREDRSGILRPEIAIAKAYGALGMRLPSRTIRDVSQKLPLFIESLTTVAQGRLVAVPGGVLIRSGLDVIGAVGVTGDVSDPDEDAAVHGIRAAGYEPDFESTEVR